MQNLVGKRQVLASSHLHGNKILKSLATLKAKIINTKADSNGSDTNSCHIEML